MTVKVLKSVADKVSANFAADVEKHRQELLAHRFSAPAQQYSPAIPAQPEIPATKTIPAKGPRAAVPAQVGRPAMAGRPEIKEHLGTPRPISDPLIEAVIKRVQAPGKPDDFVADYEIVDDTPPPPTLQQKKDALMAETLSQEGAAVQKIWPQGKRRLDSLVKADIMLKDENSRSEKERAFLDDLTNKQNKVNSIARQAATMLSEIEDLTEDNIASWVGKFTE